MNATNFMVKYLRLKVKEPFDRLMFSFKEVEEREFILGEKVKETVDDRDDLLRRRQWGRRLGLADD